MTISPKIYKMFGNRCFVCHKEKTARSKGFTFHHLKYNRNEKIYKDFKNSADYHEYLSVQIQSNPKRFVLLCRKHHFAIERMVRWHPDTLRRAYDVASRTRNDSAVKDSAVKNKTVKKSNKTVKKNNNIVKGQKKSVKKSKKANKINI